MTQQNLTIKLNPSSTDLEQVFASLPYWAGFDEAGQARWQAERVDLVGRIVADSLTITGTMPADLWATWSPQLTQRLSQPVSNIAEVASSPAIATTPASNQQVMTKIATEDAFLAPDGQVYARKRKLTQQPLFWVSLALGGLALLLLTMANSYWLENRTIEAALRRQGLYYDGFHQDIYSDEASDFSDLSDRYIRERLTEETLTIIKQMEMAPEELELADVEPALEELETVVGDYLIDLSLDIEAAHDRSDLSTKAYDSYLDELADYEDGVAEAVRNLTALYRRKASISWTSQDKDDLFEDLYYLLDPDSQIFDNLDWQESITA